MTAAANTSITGDGAVSVNGTVDLFGWSTSATAFGIHNSTTDSDYSGDFADWGINIGTGWSTLSSVEWNYLLNTRSITNRYCRAIVNGTAGIVVFPDSYTHPGSVKGIEGVNAANAPYSINSSWSAGDWNVMEEYGAVFLPAAGFRNNGTSVGTSGTPSVSSRSSNHGAIFT